MNLLLQLGRLNLAEHYATANKAVAINDFMIDMSVLSQNILYDTLNCNVYIYETRPTSVGPISVRHEATPCAQVPMNSFHVQ